MSTRPLKRPWALLVSGINMSLLGMVVNYEFVPTSIWEALLWAGVGAAFWHAYVLWAGYYDGKPGLRPLKRHWALLVATIPTGFLAFIVYAVTPRTPPWKALIWAGVGVAFWYGYCHFRGYYNGYRPRGWDIYEENG